MELKELQTQYGHSRTLVEVIDRKEAQDMIDSTRQPSPQRVGDKPIVFVCKATLLQ
jgi:hypothetical protein